MPSRRDARTGGQEGREEALPYAAPELTGVGQGSGDPRQQLRWPRPLFLLQQRRLVKGKDCALPTSDEITMKHVLVNDNGPHRYEIWNKAFKSTKRMKNSWAWRNPPEGLQAAYPPEPSRTEGLDLPAPEKQAISGSTMQWLGQTSSKGLPFDPDWKLNWICKSHSLLFFPAGPSLAFSNHILRKPPAPILAITGQVD
ncbi:hypothetical protein MG293_009516 [Ovis ammon polii]|uniref:Uncharacterized protein n=1 Tax=Ovis ammon polii TaxID=230172 RepID=A0AAD4Y7B3_OVIAM|nr:hypothetical protein MG293_009516 [Ovis ammon polii]